MPTSDASRHDTAVQETTKPETTKPESDAPETLAPKTAASPTEAPVAESGRLSARDRTVITVMLVSTFVVLLNETIMSVALPVLMRDLRVTESTGQWLTSGFLLTMAVIIPITGFLIRRVHTRLLYGVAMALFCLGTLASALAPNFPVLLVGRIIQASGTAIMMPLLMTTVMTLVPPARRGAVMGNISIVMSVAPAVGPTISGILLNSLGWRAMFWTVLPIAIVASVIGLRRMSNVGDSDHTPIDILSVVLSAFGFGGLVYGLSSIGEAASAAEPMIPLWVPFTVGIAGLVTFVLRQVALQRTDRALLDLRAFRTGTFTMACVLMSFVMMMLLGTIVLLPIYLQTVLHLQPVVTGLLLLPGGLLMGLLGPVVGRLYDRFGMRTLLLPGIVLTSAALWSTTLFSATSSMWLVLGFHLLLSVGLAFTFTPLFTGGLGSVDPRYYAYGSAIFATAQQLAGAAGVALLVTLMSLRSASLGATGASVVERTAGGVHAAFLVAAILSLVAIACAALLRPPPKTVEAKH